MSLSGYFSPEIEFPGFSSNLKNVLKRHTSKKIKEFIALKLRIQSNLKLEGFENVTSSSFSTSSSCSISCSFLEFSSSSAGSSAFKKEGLEGRPFPRQISDINNQRDKVGKSILPGFFKQMEWGGGAMFPDFRVLK